jgi:hypothetical protein
MLSSFTEAESRDVLLPLCVLFSISFSLRKKNVVGPEWPGFASDGACAAELFFAFSVRDCESSDEFIAPVSSVWRIYYSSGCSVVPVDGM